MLILDIAIDQNTQTADTGETRGIETSLLCSLLFPLTLCLRLASCGGGRQCRSHSDKHTIRQYIKKGWGCGFVTWLISPTALQHNSLHESAYWYPGFFSLWRSCYHNQSGFSSYQSEMHISQPPKFSIQEHPEGNREWVSPLHLTDAGVFCVHSMHWAL